MITLDFYIQQIVVIFLVLNLKNYCYFKFRDIILLSIDTIMDLIYTIVIYLYRIWIWNDYSNFL